MDDEPVKKNKKIPKEEIFVEEVLNKPIKKKTKIPKENVIIDEVSDDVLLDIKKKKSLNKNYEEDDIIDIQSKVDESNNIDINDEKHEVPIVKKKKSSKKRNDSDETSSTLDESKEVVIIDDSKFVKKIVKYKEPSTSSSNIITNTLIRNPSNRIICMAHFNDGWTVLEQFKLFKKFSKEIPIIFDESGIKILTINKTKSIISKSEYYGNFLLDYYFNSNLAEENGSAFPRKQVISVELSQLISNLSSGKKAQFKLIMYENTPNKLFIDSPNGNNSIKSVHVEPNPELTSFEILDQKPSKHFVKVPIDLLSSAFKEVSTSKEGFSIFRTFRKGLELLSASSAGANISDYNWGTCDEKESPIETKIDIKVIKNFVSIKNFNNRGIVNIYGDISGIIRMDTVVGTFGKNTTILFDSSNISISDDTSYVN